MAYVDAIDSHYQAVKARMNGINPSRGVKGLLMARDWPPTAVSLESFYLLTLSDSSIGRQGYSQASPMKIAHVQWVWIIKGTDLQQGVRQSNRGDRFRTAFEMKDELTKALYPGFTEKMNFSLDGDGNWVGTPENPVEYITWTPVDFVEKSDKDSGVIWGTATIRIWQMTDTIASSYPVGISASSQDTLDESDSTS